MAGMVWKFYKYLLAKPTNWCYRHSVIGEILMFFIFPLWAFWPMIFPWINYPGIPKNHHYIILVASVPITVVLTILGVRIVKRNWRRQFDPSVTEGIAIQIDSIRAGIEGHHLKVYIKGSKPSDFVLKQAFLSFEGDKFWEALSACVGDKLISTFKMLMYPVKLCPKMLKPDQFVSGSTVVNAVLDAGLGKYMDTVKTKLKELSTTHGDPPFYMRAEYGVVGLQWKSLGVLFSVHLTIGDLLWAIDTNGTLNVGADGKATRGDAGLFNAEREILPPLVPEEYKPLSSDDKDLDLAIKLSENEAREKNAKPNDDNSSSSSSIKLKRDDTNEKPAHSINTEEEDLQQAIDISKIESSDDKKESEISQIIDMGFSRNQAIEALKNTDQNVERAINYLLSKSS